MISKKILQAKVEWQRKAIEGEEASRRDAWDRLQKFAEFTENLLTLEPSLKRFRIKEDGWGSSETWDTEGVKRAVEFNESKTLADRYFEPERPDDAVRMGKVASK